MMMPRLAQAHQHYDAGAKSFFAHVETYLPSLASYLFSHVELKRRRKCKHDGFLNNAIVK
jgi:hypothetical protein